MLARPQRSGRNAATASDPQGSSSMVAADRRLQASLDRLGRGGGLLARRNGSRRRAPQSTPSLRNRVLETKSELGANAFSRVAWTCASATRLYRTGSHSSGFPRPDPRLRECWPFTELDATGASRHPASPRHHDARDSHGAAPSTDATLAGVHMSGPAVAVRSPSLFPEWPERPGPLGRPARGRGYDRVDLDRDTFKIREPGLDACRLHEHDNLRLFV